MSTFAAIVYIALSMVLLGASAVTAVIASEADCAGGSHASS
jgi:hypothetical protein